MEVMNPKYVPGTPVRQRRGESWRMTAGTTQVRDGVRRVLCEWVSRDTGGQAAWIAEDDLRADESSAGVAVFNGQVYGG